MNTTVRPIYLSEFGGIAFIPPGHDVSQAEAWGYSGVEKTAEDALDRLDGLYRGLLKYSTDYTGSATRS